MTAGLVYVGVLVILVVVFAAFVALDYAIGMVVACIPIACPYCGKNASCSPSKGIWCAACENRKVGK